MGGGTCFVSVSPDGHAVLAANYGGGSVVAFGVDPVTGALRQSISYDQHTGHSVNPNRQTRPAAHSIYPTPDGAHALAVDLGTDEIIHYRLDAAAATLTRIGQTLVAPGSGPRHLAFDADGKTVFAIFELTNQIAVYRWEGDSLKLLYTAPTLPADFKGESTTAEVAMAPNQSFVYGSNRGHNSIAVFSYDAATGKLSPVAHTPTQGDGPRHFAIDPTGRFLVVANQKSDSLVAFKIDPTLGTLTPTGSTVKIESPVCVRFALPTRP